MNIEESGINPNVANVQKIFEENFGILLNIHFIKEVFEEVIPNNQRNNLDDSKIVLITTRCFEIMKNEKIEAIVDSEAQKPITIRVAFEETDSGYLVHDSIFKINQVRNISEVKEKQDQNSNNGCIKFALSNGKEELSGVEEARLADIPQELKLIEGSLLYVSKDTSIRRNILLLSGLNCFVFQSMQQFKHGLNQLTQRIEKHARDMENREKERERKKREAESKEQERFKEKERVKAQREAAKAAADTQMTEETMTRNFNDNSNAFMGSRENSVRAESTQYQNTQFNQRSQYQNNQYQNNQNQRNQYQNNQFQNKQYQSNQQQQQQQNNQWFDEDEEEFINRNLDIANANANMGEDEDEDQNNNNVNGNTNNNGGGQQQMTAEECNELLSILYDDD